MVHHLYHHLGGISRRAHREIERKKATGRQIAFPSLGEWVGGCRRAMGLAFHRVECTIHSPYPSYAAALRTLHPEAHGRPASHGVTPPLSVLELFPMAEGPFRPWLETCPWLLCTVEWFYSQ